MVYLIFCINLAFYKNFGTKALLTKIIILAGIVLAVLSTIMFLMAIIPRVTKRAPESILHYKGILGLPREKYVTKMIEIDDEELTKDYLDTIYSLSSIQKKKNVYLALGCYFLIISICLLGLSFILHNF